MCAQETMVIAEIPLWVSHSNNDGPDDWMHPLSQGKNGAVRAAQQALHSYYSNESRTKKCAIYSIDVHGSLFCTAGGDGTVRMWNVHALFQKQKAKMAHFDAVTGRYVSSESSSSNSSAQEEEDSVPKEDGTVEPSVTLPLVHDLNANVRSKKKGTAVASSPAKATVPTTTALPAPLPPTSPRRNSHQRLLCTLSAHTGSSVLAVRFSHSGRFLASAGDDGSVCIYAPNENNHTQWSRIQLCRGHNLDVVDLAWSPDDAYLVSCSLDSATPIIVWKLTDLQNNYAKKSMIATPFKILGASVHTSTVKGVAFDPAGSYFCSSGDDPAVCIWRTHDDWGLEKRIDADAGIFRKWTTTDDDVQALSNQSLFRRISWSTDGAFVCSTNSVVKNKHVASTISREQWHVSGGANPVDYSGAANLVGHKQPVVVSRHAAHLLKVGRNSSKDGNGKDRADDAMSDEEHSPAEDVPEYATLLALGDRRGFVSVWSTRKSRPLFKVQCSESHCTVTDLSWGSLGNGDLFLLVSLLDGQVSAFRFAVPDELGSVLTDQEKARVFQLRYGIDPGNTGDMGGLLGRKYGGSAGPNLIENALQMSLEEDDRNANDDDLPLANDEHDFSVSTSGANVQQEESRSATGKKRIRPVLVQVGGNDRNKQKTNVVPPDGRSSTSVTNDPLQNAIVEADKAAAAVETSHISRKDTSSKSVPVRDRHTDHESGDVVAPNHHRHSAHPLVTAIRHSTERSHVADLPLLVENYGTMENVVPSVYVVECVNISKVPVGSKGGPVACVDITISNAGQILWKDQILGTSCSALSASKKILAVGTTDGSIQLYGTSPTSGWSCGLAFRSHAPLIFGNPIVSLRLIEKDSVQEELETGSLEMLVVTSDGGFGVWTILPDIQLQYKGSLMPALTHMSFSSGGSRMPTLSRIHVTDSGYLFLLLSLESSSRLSSGGRASSNFLDAGSGGSLQGFVYDRKSELWLRVADSRFVLSDFYTVLPSTSSNSLGVLSRMDDAVRLGSLQSSLKADQRSRQYDQHADAMYQDAEGDSGNFFVTRAHCEDRMACALAMKSSMEFKHWLRLYVRVLVIRGQTSQIRMLVSMILYPKEMSSADISERGNCCWWLSLSSTILCEDRVQLVRGLVVPEMSKSRTMQRLTNEIFLEIEAMDEGT